MIQGWRQRHKRGLPNHDGAIASEPSEGMEKHRCLGGGVPVIAERSVTTCTASPLDCHRPILWRRLVYDAASGQVLQHGAVPAQEDDETSRGPLTIVRPSSTGAGKTASTMALGRPRLAVSEHCGAGPSRASNAAAFGAP